MFGFILRIAFGASYERLQDFPRRLRSVVVVGLATTLLLGVIGIEATKVAKAYWDALPDNVIISRYDIRVERVDVPSCWQQVSIVGTQGGAPVDNLAQPATWPEQHPAAPPTFLGRFVLMNNCRPADPKALAKAWTNDSM
jgi:hypothetical protein